MKEARRRERIAVLRDAFVIASEGSLSSYFNPADGIKRLLEREEHLLKQENAMREEIREEMGVKAPAKGKKKPQGATA